ncbi:MAG: ABC transporter permease, partial [Capnocytophaga sp.]|nr:ABC transporter permease [Capnocytophaga sp.]
LDISALMGYTGAIFKKFFGTSVGLWVSMGVLLAWVLFIFLGIKQKTKRKDF